MSRINLAIGCPAYGGSVIAQQNRMWLELGNAIGGSPDRFRLTMFGNVDVQPIDKARNMLIAYAMTRSSNWLFSVDADTWVESTKDEDAGFQILRMISEADRLGAVIASAAVVKRTGAETLDVGRAAYELAVYENPTVADKHVGVAPSWLEGKGRRLVPVYAVGAACFALNLTKLASIEPAIMYRFTPQLSEDLDFCAQLRQHFGEKAVLVDPRIRTGHQSRGFPLYAFG